MGDVKNLSIELEKWSKEITKGSAFPRQNNPSQAVWNMLLGTTKLGNSMKYLLSHLKSEKETLLIRKNIHHVKFNENLASSSTLDTRNSPLLLQNDIIAPVMEDLQVLNLESRKLSEQHYRLEMQKAALNAILENRKSELSQFSHFSHDLQSLKKVTQDNQPSTNVKPVVILQTDLQEIMGELKDMRLRLIQSYHENDPNLHDKKLEMWSKIKLLLENASPKLVLGALTNLASMHADRMHTVARNVNSEEKIQHLGDNLPSVSDEIEKSVHDLLVAMCAKHVTTRVNAHNLQYKATCAQAAALVLKTNAIESFKQKSSEESYLKCAEEVINMKLDLEGKRAAMVTMSHLRQGLERRIQLAKIAEKELVDEFRNISEFDEQVGAALFHIKGLELNQEQISEKITEELNHVRQMVADSVEKMSIPTPFAFMQDEFILFLRTLRERVSACASERAIGPVISELSKENEIKITNVCPFDTTWANLLFLSLQQKQTSRQLKQRIATYKADCNAMSAVHHREKFTMENAKDLLRKCGIHDNNLTAEVTPILNSCCDQLATNYKKVFQVTSLVDDWWNQPSQRINLLK